MSLFKMRSLLHRISKVLSKGKVSKETDKNQQRKALLALQRVFDLDPKVHSRLVLQIVALKYMRHPSHRSPRLLALRGLCHKVRNENALANHTFHLARKNVLAVVECLMTRYQKDDLIDDLLFRVQRQWTTTWGRPPTHVQILLFHQVSDDDEDGDPCDKEVS